MTSLCQCTTLPPVYADQVYRDFEHASADDINRCVRPVILAALARLCITHGLEVTDDLIQDVYVRLVRGRGRYDDAKGAATTWIEGACRQACCDAARSSFRHSRRLQAYGQAHDTRQPSRAGRYLHNARGGGDSQESI